MAINAVCYTGRAVFRIGCFRTEVTVDAAFGAGELTAFRTLNAFFAVDCFAAFTQYNTLFACFF